ncbi:MAG: tetratricopeptide repeat protein [Pseudomonadota bacterium]
MNDLTEEQQVEQLRDWWKENGTSLMVVLAVGIAGAIGWVKWQDSKQATREAAGTLFDRAVDAASRNDSITLDQRVDELVAEYGDSAYVPLAKLRQASVLMADGDAAEARGLLASLLVSEKDTALAPLIATRLARVEIYLDEPEAALATLDGVRAGRFEPFFNEIRGDAFVALGQSEDARNAYQSALDDPGQPQLIDTAFVGIKLAELATADDDPVVAP